ncbi:hypothetical protein AB0M12_44020 [Nocardia vinacea]
MAASTFAWPGDRWEECRMSRRRLVLENSALRAIRMRALGGEL